MVDTVITTTTVSNDHDDWEVAVDTGEFDKLLEQQEKARAANQEVILPPVPSTTNDDSRTSSIIDLTKSNKPIRILKRPTSQSQLSTNNDVTNFSIATSTTATNNTNNINNINLSSSNNVSSSSTVPVVSIIPRNQTKDSTSSSQSVATPNFSTNSSSLQSIKPAIKTYEQRELEYRLARLRIMGEEESSAKDDDDGENNNLTSLVEPPTVPTDDSTKTTISNSSSTNSSRITNKMSGLSQQSFHCHSTPGSYASNLYALNNVPTNTGAIHFTLNNNNNNNNNSTPSLGTGPFSSPNFSPHLRGSYSTPYSQMPPPPPLSSVSRYPLQTTTTTTTLYMTSTAPFVSVPSSSSSVSSSYHYRPPPPQQQQQHPNMTKNDWFHYQQTQAPYGTPQYGNPQ